MVEPESKPGVWHLKISVLCVSREGIIHWLVPEPVFLSLHQELTPLAHISIGSQLAEWRPLPQTGPTLSSWPRSHLTSLLTWIPAWPHPQSMLYTEKSFEKHRSDHGKSVLKVFHSLLLHLEKSQGHFYLHPSYPSSMPRALSCRPNSKNTQHLLSH